ncbi:MAG: tripartite tricarboxylate transporter TctB family protein [Actinobacteria bacterium]|nr:tripartite tricarboxylate transporter TctB family protein [Actinomycetota bacterium]NDE83916.1 tripartite tricarboxylate transporter TctB family protein [Actinomycetota bacterium]
MNALRFSLVLIFLCGLAIWQITQIPKSTLYDAVGASFVPKFAVGIFILFVVLYVYQSLTRKLPDIANNKNEKPLKNPINRLSYFLIGFLLFVLLVKPIGFILSGSLCGLGISRSFDTKISIRSFIISFLISVSVWILFSIMLSVNLGPAFSFKI